jgi:hypothetical protein
MTNANKTARTGAPEGTGPAATPIGGLHNRKPLDRDRRPPTMVLNTATVSNDAEALEVMRRHGREILSNAVAVQGPRALENPLSAAKFHEAGHAVVYTHFGEEVLGCEIWQHKRGAERGQWAGKTLLGREWKSDPTTSPEEDFRAACCVYAGVLAEFLFDPANFRGGSSVDEVLLAKGLAHNVALKTRRQPGDVLGEVLRVTTEILISNADVVRKIAADLKRHGAVRKLRLKALLGRVPSPARGRS